jgi:hypothetical protein
MTKTKENIVKQRAYILGVHAADILDVEMLEEETDMFDRWNKVKKDITNLSPPDIQVVTASIYWLARNGIKTPKDYREKYNSPIIKFRRPSAEAMIRGIFPQTDEDRDIVRRVRNTKL